VCYKARHDIGEVAEWFKAAVLKTAEGNTSVSSNLTFSAIKNQAARLTWGAAFFCVRPAGRVARKRTLAGAGFGVSWFDEEGFNIRSSVAWRTAGDATGKSEITQPTVYFKAVKRF
jgi:hypothetical protein